MAIIDIYSGFLGAGKTTLIKKMLQEVYAGQKIVLIENEFGQIGIDSGFLQEAGIQITEMNSGCICCSLVGDFGKALQQVLKDYAPDRVVIEPSGVGKLSDVIAAVEKVPGVKLGYTVAVADAGKVKVYMKNFGEFYNNQIETANTILLSRTDAIPQDKLDAAVALIREHNPEATVVTTPWDQLTGAQIAEAMEGKATLQAALEELEEEHHHHGEHCCCGHHHDHEHHHHHEEGECCCGHHHDHEHHHHHEEGECCCGHDHHEHHHHHEEGECCCGHDHHEHHHHHEEGECCCGHDHHEHHHHHADEVFTSWGKETAKKFTEEQLKAILTALDTGAYGTILRAKGIVPATDGWLHFDYVPEEHSIRSGSAAVTGKLCVIGAELNETELENLFCL